MPCVQKGLPSRRHDLPTMPLQQNNKKKQRSVGASRRSCFTKRKGTEGKRKMNFKNLVKSFGTVGISFISLFIITIFVRDTFTNYMTSNQLTVAETQEIFIFALVGLMALGLFLTISMAYYQDLEDKG